MNLTRISTRDSILFSVVVIGGLLAFYLSDVLTEQRASLPKPPEVEELTLQGSRLKGFLFGGDGLLADWYWMRSLQYIGDKVVNSPNESINLDDLRSLDPRLLYPYLDNLTDLDPKHMAAYSYGAIVLPAVDPELAIKLTEKGIAANPGEFRLYQYLGYINWRLGRYEKAAEIYERGSRLPGSPSFMKMMAAMMKTEGAGRETARTMFKQMAQDATDEETQLFAERRLVWLVSLDERDAIRDVMRKAKERTGRCPDTWPEIIPLLRDVKLPEGGDFRVDGAKNVVDPSGAAYLIDPDNCDVTLDPVNTKIPIQ